VLYGRRPPRNRTADDRSPPGAIVLLGGSVGLDQRDPPWRFEQDRGSQVGVLLVHRDEAENEPDDPADDRARDAGPGQPV
jgi:hypothetical protein